MAHNNHPAWAGQDCKTTLPDPEASCADAGSAVVLPFSRFPTAFEMFLVFPLGRIAGAGTGFDIIPPHILGTFRSVHRFLQATEHVWQPIHLSR